MTGPDVTYMRRALTLARKGIGTTSPNPAVGCVIVKDGSIIGEGWHRRAGEPHAEVHALNMAGSSARGADVYVTLEPCSHTGKTPPCCDALIAAGVARVFAGMSDPNPKVNGNGLARLTAAGIATTCGVLEEQCRELNRPFIKSITSGLPYTTYKCAMTLDGKVATASGSSQWISGEASRRTVHRLRSRCDAIMVGVDTVITDDPQLTVRHVRGKDPLRVVVDSTLRTPLTARILSPELATGTVLATTVTSPDAHAPYHAAGAQIMVCRADGNRVELSDLWRQLGSRGIQSLFLEGGSTLAGAALRRHLIDECLFFCAPKIIGQDGYAPFAISGITDMAEALRFRSITARRSGSDLMITAYPEI